jgi:hypothetical protein
MLRLEDAWIWDSWIADDGERYHLFFLKAPRALADAGLRHPAATIGHASSHAPRLSDGVLAHARSADLTTWELRPPLTEPAGFGQIEVLRDGALQGL